MTVFYLPSCNFKAAHPDVSLKIQAYLRNKPDTEICGCCRVSQSKFHEGDTVLTNCVSCAIITDEVSPQANEMSLYEYLLQDPLFPWPDHHGEQITVQDCYRATHKPQVQRAVRECLRRMNMVPVEIEENYEKSRFDGPFRYTKIPSGNLKIAPVYFNKLNDEFIEILPPEEQEKIMKEWVSQYQTDRVVVYCNNCLKGVKLGGADGLHLLDLMSENL